MVLACPQCSKVLSNGSNLRRHLAEVHGHMSRVEKWEAQKVEEEWEREMCPVCQMFLQSPKEIYYHAKRNHNFEGVVQKETFANYDEFEKWKETMEKLHASCWNRKHQTVTSNVCYRYFRCHRWSKSSL
ncbi:zinc finger, C2H2 type, partial [Cooperia oncophora]